MKWEKMTPTQYKAGDNNYKFVINKRFGFWYPQFVSLEKCFNLPRQKTVADAKRICQENYYWEE